MTCKGKIRGHNFLASKCLDCGDPQQTLGVKRKESKYEKEKKELSKIKIEYSYQELGILMSRDFKGNIWWIFSKYEEHKIRQAYKVCKEQEIHEIAFLLAVLKNNA